MISRKEHNGWVSYAAWAVFIMMAFSLAIEGPALALGMGALLAAAITAIMYLSAKK